MLVCLFHFAREAAGASRTRHSPLPRSRGPKGWIKTRALSAPRDREVTSGCLTFESVAIVTDPVIPGQPAGLNPESITTIGSMDSLMCNCTSKFDAEPVIGQRRDHDAHFDGERD